MSYRFHKSHKKVIEFDCKNEIHKIVFNHYIMRKVNHHRMKGDLPNNQFKLTVRAAANDMSLSRATISRLVCEFEDKGIINCIKKAGKGGSISIYEYATEEKCQTMQKIEPLGETLNEPLSEPVKISDFKDFKDLGVPLSETLDEPLGETFKIKHINKVLNKDTIYFRVVNYLNQKSSKKFKSTTNKTKSLILARLNEGFVEEDFYKVIDIKCEQWSKTKMEKYLRPETLFSNKFEGYLNERISAKNKQNIKHQDVKNQKCQYEKNTKNLDDKFDTSISKLTAYNSNIESIADSYKIDFKY